MSAAKLPNLNPNEFYLWKMRIEQYFLMTDYSLWEVILNGDSPIPTRVIEEKRFGGNKETKKVQKTLLKQQYENFTGLSFESLYQIHDRLQKLISQHEILGESLSQEDINLKFLRSIPTEWRTHAFIWRNKTDWEEQSLNDLFNNLKIYEAEVKISSSASASIQNIAFVSSQNTDNTNEPVSAIASVFAASSATTATGNDTLIESVGSYDWSFQAEEEPTNYAIMAFTSSNSSSSDNEDWVSDLEDDFEAEFPQNAPSFVLPTAQVKTPRPFVKPVENSIPAANHKTTIPKPKSHGNSRNRKACFVCKSLTHLIKDCDYYEKKMAQTPTRNHAQWVNHPQYARMTLLNPQRHVVPIAVLTKSKLVPLTAARQVTTGVSLNNVTRPRPSKTVVTNPHSLPRRNINRRPSPKASTFPLKVTAAKAPMFNVVQGVQETGTKGVIYSGCSRHMTGNMSYLSDFEEINGGYVAFGGNPNGGKISSKGKIRTGKLDFDDVYFVKELKFNLFTVSQMCDKKNIVLFTDTECIVLSPKFKLPDENQVLLRVPRENNMYNVDLKNIVPSGDLTYLFAKASLDEGGKQSLKLKSIKQSFKLKSIKEVVEVVTTAKLMTEVVTAAATITAATTPITVALITTAPSAARRRKKWNMARFKMDYFKGMSYNVIRLIFEKYFNSNVAFLEKTKEQMEEEDSIALKRASKSQAEKVAKKQKLDEEDTMQFHHHTGLFPPPKSDLSSTGLKELFNEPKTKKLKDKSTNVEPESVKKGSDAPIIEDWMSDDEEKKVEKKEVKPSIKRINFVKVTTDNNPRETVKNGEHPKQNTHRKRGNQRNWNNFMCNTPKLARSGILGSGRATSWINNKRY
nr:ribonuclease H-like domain-containing protein [Tanacetum cinerariifolium]